MNAQLSPNTVALQVNNQSLMQKLKFAFTNKSTVVSELVQNARRSGATRVEVTYDQENKTLTVSDDGSGIDNFQTLLSVADSGWNEKVMKEDSPFGLGFLSAIYAADHVVIRSHGRQISASTEAILNFENVEVVANDILDDLMPKGTRVFLTEIDLGVMFSPEQFFAGYPIPVIWNGKEIERKYATDSELSFIESRIGLIHIPGYEKEHFNGTHSAHPVLFFQGVTVYEHDNRRSSNSVIIHLNNSFTARLPDRDTIHDQDEVLKLANEIILDIWRDRMVELKATLGEKEFCEYYPLLKDIGRMDLLNDIDYVPGEVIYESNEEPQLECNSFDCTISPLRVPMSRDDLSKYILLREFEEITTDILEGEEDESLAPNDFGPAMCLYHCSEEIRVISNTGLDKDHWIYKEIKSWDAITAKPVEMVEPKIGCKDGLDHYLAKPKFCKYVEYYLDGELIFTDSYHSVVLQVENTNYLCIPQFCESGYGVRQGQDFRDEWNDIAEDRIVNEEGNLEKFIIANRAAGSDLALMEELLKRVGFPAFPPVHGQSFHLSIDENGCFEVQQAQPENQ